MSNFKFIEIDRFTDVTMCIEDGQFQIDGLVEDSGGNEVNEVIVFIDKQKAIDIAKTILELTEVKKQTGGEK